MEKFPFHRFDDFGGAAKYHTSRDDRVYINVRVSLESVTLNSRLFWRDEVQLLAHRQAEEGKDKIAFQNERFGMFLVCLF